MIRIVIISLLIFKFFAGYTQVIENFSCFPIPVKNEFTIKFDLLKKDTIRLGLVTTWGFYEKEIYDNVILEAGQYVIKTNLENLEEGVYFLFLDYGEDDFHKSIIKLQSDSIKTNSPDIYEIKYFDTIYKTITDTQHVVVFDTITIVDTLKLMVIDTISTSFVENENIVINNSSDFIYNGVLDLGDSDADYFELFELSGKLVESALVKNSQISLKDLIGTLYIIVLYKNGEVIKSSRLLIN